MKGRAITPAVSPEIRPRILIIDDELGAKPPSKFRKDFCAALRLRDVPLAQSNEYNGTDDYLADATFVPGQRTLGGKIENARAQTVKQVLSGWPFEPEGPRWALVCVDLSFRTGPGPQDFEPFGQELVEAIWKEDPDIPLIMLSTHETVFVNRHFPKTPVRIFSKWDGNPRTKDSALWDFAKMLFTECLASDGSLRVVDRNEPDGTPYPVARDEDQRLRGSSVALLQGLRKARRILAHGVRNDVLISGSNAESNLRFAKYMHDHYLPALRYGGIHFPGRPGFEEFDVTSGIRDFSMTLTYGTAVVKGVHEFGPLALEVFSRAIKTRDDKSAKTKTSRNFQVVALTDVDVEKETISNEPLRLALRKFQRLHCPTLGDEDTVVEKTFARVLAERARSNGGPGKNLADDALALLKRQRWPGGRQEMEDVAEQVDRDTQYNLTIHVSDVRLAFESLGKELLDDVETKTAGSGETFEDLLSSIASYRFRQAREGETSEVAQAWPKLQNSLRRLVDSLLDTAAAESTPVGNERFVWTKLARHVGIVDAGGRLWGDPDYYTELGSAERAAGPGKPDIKGLTGKLQDRMKKISEFYKLSGHVGRKAIEK